MAGPLLGSLAAGGLQGYATGSAQNLHVGAQTNIAQWKSEVDALMNERIAERAAAAKESDYKRDRADTLTDQAAKFKHEEKLQKGLIEGKLAEKTGKPVYPKIIKLKDENDKEYLIDENTGAIGRPVSATEGLPAKSHWFSPDEPAVPGTEASIVWTASDGSALPGGLASLYSQISKPSAGKPGGEFDPAAFDSSVKKVDKGAAEPASAPQSTPKPTPKPAPVKDKNVDYKAELDAINKKLAAPKINLAEGGYFKQSKSGKSFLGVVERKRLEQRRDQLKRLLGVE